jgi:DNA-binding NarL/FixJ family response regulator
MKERAMEHSDSSRNNYVFCSPVSPTSAASIHHGLLEIVICEPQTLMREVLAHLLVCYPDTKVVAETTDFEDAIGATRATGANVLLFDPLELRARHRGATVAAILRTCPELRLFGVSTDISASRLRFLIRHGLQVCVSKREGAGVLCKALAALRDGTFYLSPEIVSLTTRSTRPPPGRSELGLIANPRGSFESFQRGEDRREAPIEGARRPLVTRNPHLIGRRAWVS